MWRRILGAAVGAAALAGGAAAAEGPGFAPGATLPPGALRHPACKLAMRYVTLVEERRFKELGALFAADGVYYGANEEVVTGPAQVETFYAELFKRMKAGPPRIAGLVPAGPRDCYLELIGGPRASRPGAGGGPLAPMSSAVDRFTLDAGGKVVRLYIFFRPRAAAVEAMAAKGTTP